MQIANRKHYKLQEDTMSLCLCLKFLEILLIRFGRLNEAVYLLSDVWRTVYHF